MRKLFVLFVIILLLLISCDFPPVQPTHVTLRVQGRDWNDVYWQMVKKGDPDTGEYKHYPINDFSLYDLEPGTNYTLRFYKVENTIIENEAGTLVEKRLIGDTYETHIVIDHWETIIAVTWTKESGLGCKIEQSWPI